VEVAVFHFVVDWIGRQFGRAEPIAIPTFGRLVSIKDDRTAVELEMHAHPPAHLKAMDFPPSIDWSPTPHIRKSSREAGHRFHRLEFKKLFETVGHWETVEFLTAAGTPIACLADLPKSADGGIDVVIRIVADTEHGARTVAGRIRSLIVRQSY
jgi:hypothetical protein